MKRHADHANRFQPSPRVAARCLWVGSTLLLVALPALAESRRLNRELGPQSPRRPALAPVSERLGGRPESVAASAASPLRHDSSLHCDVERSALDFGEVTPDENLELPGALVIRVFGERDWVLRLRSDPLLEVADRGEAVPASRLEYRTASSGGYLPMPSGAPAILARGRGTSGAGELVVVDLRLRLESSDPLGSYRSSLRLAVDEF